MPQPPKKLLDQVRACPELVETVVSPTFSTGEAWPFAALRCTNFRGLTWPRIAIASIPNWQQKRVRTWRCDSPITLFEATPIQPTATGWTYRMLLE
jgi:hypothetical protein